MSSRKNGSPYIDFGRHLAVRPGCTTRSLSFAALTACLITSDVRYRDGRDF